MKKDQAFTLVELLAVIVILAIILAIAIPAITGLINNVTKNAFESDAKMILKAIEYKMLEDETYDPTTINESNILSELNISDDNYESLTVTIVDGKPYIEIIGKNKWAGLTACGFYNDMEAGADVECGTSSGGTFACGDTLIDSRDDEEYATVEMGDQCWMAENLRHTGNGCLSNTWNDTAPFDACLINGGSGWDQDEVLYQWGAAMNGEDTPESQGLCPEGWYIPSHDEWTDLERYVCNEAGNGDCNTKFPKDTTTAGWRGTDEGQQLKSTDPSWNGTNTVGFNAKPAGDRLTSGSLDFVGSSGYWWSSSPDGSSAWSRGLISGNSDVGRLTFSQALGYSVRCVLGQ